HQLKRLLSRNRRNYLDLHRFLESLVGVKTAADLNEYDVIPSHLGETLEERVWSSRTVERSNVHDLKITLAGSSIDGGKRIISVWNRDDFVGFLWIDSVIQACCHIGFDSHSVQ